MYLGKDGEKQPLKRTAEDPRTLKDEAVPPFTLIAFVIGMVVCAVGNAVTFKKMLDSYKSHDAAHPHNYEFFVNQFNVALYVLMAASIVLFKICRPGGRLWLLQQEFSIQQIMIMACLDALAGFLASVGGAYTGGAVQTLINQCIIPLTLVMSRLFLKASYSVTQQMGAYTILLGTIVAVIPAFRQKDGEVGGTSVAGAIIFFGSVLPAAFSNVYKEHSFKTSENADVYFLTTVVSALQVALGFALAPILALPSFGGTALRDIPTSFSQGFMCFLGENSQEGDHCNTEPLNMLSYVFVNFLLNIISLLVTKHGSAALVVVSSALALPLTNFAFSSKVLLGADAEPLTKYSILALLLVVTGFVVYSLFGRDDGIALPLQAAGGSVMYVRPVEKCLSAPSTPGHIHTPLPKLTYRTSQHRTSPLVIGSSSASFKPLQKQGAEVAGLYELNGEVARSV